ncbi:MAG: ABC transporter ATP-binding protein [Achromobacter sp.]
MSPPQLELQSVSLAFGGHRVLHDISLQVQPAEVLALIGPNGAGKSALLNCVSGVYRPQPGARIRLAGSRIDGLPPHRIAAAGVARTFQGLHLAPDMTVQDNILLGLSGLRPFRLGRALAWPPAALRAEVQARRDAREIAGLCRLEPLLDTLCGALPLGVLRRVDLARALIGRPKVLLLDEPASGLSHDERPLIGEMVKLALSRQGLAVLWIEHDLELVLSQASRAIVLHHGEQVQSGVPADPAQRTQILAAYKSGRPAPEPLAA